MTWRNSVLVAGMGVAALLLAGCGSAVAAAGTGSSSPATPGRHTDPDHTVNVVASTDVYGDIASRIGGSAVTVTSLITNPDADPHSYEASTRNQLELSKADIVIENGGGYDDFVDRMLAASGGSHATVLNAVDISGVHKSADGELNEHVWYDFPAMARLTDKIVDALASADPAGKVGFTERGAAFKRDLTSMEATEASIDTAHHGAGVAITEPVPLYMLQACGLVNRTPAAFSEAVENGTAVSALVLKDTLDLFDQHAVKLLVYNEQATDPSTQLVLDAARKDGMPVVPVTETLPKGKNYVTWMRDNLGAIRQALR